MREPFTWPSCVSRPSASHSLPATWQRSEPHLVEAPLLPSRLRQTPCCLFRRRPQCRTSTTVYMSTKCPARRRSPGYPLPLCPPQSPLPLPALQGLTHAPANRCLARARPPTSPSSERHTVSGLLPASSRCKASHCTWSETRICETGGASVATSDMLGRASSSSANLQAGRRGSQNSPGASWPCSSASSTWSPGTPLAPRLVPSGDGGPALLEEVVRPAHLSVWSLTLLASSHPVIPTRAPMMSPVGELYGFTTETSTPAPVASAGGNNELTAKAQLSPQDTKRFQVSCLSLVPQLVVRVEILGKPCHRGRLRSIQKHFQAPENLGLSSAQLSSQASW